jgi:glycosyltransferase involved in cell wall biosynthesis
MRIVYDYQVFWWQQYGGISRYFYEIASRIADMEGQEVQIFAPLYINEYFQNGGKILPWGVKVPQIPHTGRVIATVNLMASCLLIKPRQDVNIFHETYYSKTDSCPSSAKRVITVHDMIHEKFSNIFPPEDMTRQIKAHAVHRADHVICPSEHTRQDLIELLGVPEEKTSVVYHGYSLITKEEVSKPALGEKPYILYVGRRERYKNFENLLRAYANSSLLKNEFSMVCFGGGGFTVYERTLMDSLSLSPNSITHVSGADTVLAGLYASAAAFVYPPLYEGFGIPPLEAMGLGCPVVCANSSSLPEVVGEAAEFFDPADESAMRAAIERVVSSSEYAALLVEKGRERIKKFSWEKCALDTVNVYKQVLQG